jgi:polysaccharide pyruvyl transferase WcaK-like protein
MDIYLKWYYGYQNFGDELLLLWLINWLSINHPFDTLYIESQNQERLTSWLKSSKKFVKTDIDNIICVPLHSQHKYTHTYKVFGWGEIVSDARPFPWNGRNYLLWFVSDIWRKNYSILGGIGSVKKLGTSLLYKQFLGRAKEVIVRDEQSLSVAQTYTWSSFLYHDFAYDVLDDIDISSKKRENPYIIINTNRYLRDETVIDTIRQTVKKHPDHMVYFFPAAWWSDELLYSKIQKIIPQTLLYDRRINSLEKTIRHIAHADHVVAARLHVLLVAQYYNVPFTPFIYQEKIEKVILFRE